MARFVLCNGEHCPDGQIAIDADDEGLLLGMAAFETLRTHGGRLFGLQAHLDRLGASALALGMSIPNLDLIAEELEQAASMIEGEAVVRVTLTASGTRLVRAADLPRVPSPFRCVTRPFLTPPWLDGTVKHTSRAFSIRAVADARVEEVIWVDDDNHMLEGTQSNVFAVIDHALVTPPVDGRILAGVTREAIIEAAFLAGIAINIGPIHAEANFEALYVSSTLKALTPIDSLNGRQLPAQCPVGTAIVSAFREITGAQ